MLKGYMVKERLGTPVLVVALEWVCRILWKSTEFEYSSGLGIHDSVWWEISCLLFCQLASHMLLECSIHDFVSCEIFLQTTSWCKSLFCQLGRALKSTRHGRRVVNAVKALRRRICTFSSCIDYAKQYQSSTKALSVYVSLLKLVLYVFGIVFLRKERRCISFVV